MQQDTSNVGDIIVLDYDDEFGHEQLEALPAGTRLYDFQSAAVRVVDGDIWQFEDQCPYSEGRYLVVDIPEPQVSEIDELAAILFGVRNQALGEAGLYNYQPSYMDYQHRIVYRALAEFVIARDNDTSDPEMLPSMVLDSEGDYWTLRANGSYSISTEAGHTSYLDLANIFGVQDVIW